MLRKANNDNVILSDIPEIPEEISRSLRPYQNTRAAGLVDFTADGEAIFIGTRFADLPQIHRVDRPGGARRQLTFETETIAGAWRRPGSDDLAYAQDVGGGEFYQIFLLDTGTGKSRLLTDGTSRNTGAQWSRDGSKLAFTSTRRNGRSNDIWLLEPDRGDDAELVMEAEDGSAWVAADWSADGQRLLLQQYVSITDSRIHLLDLGSGERTLLIGGDDNAASWSPIGFDASGERVFLTTDAEGEYENLGVLTIETGDVEVVTGHIEWNVEGAAQSRSRRTLAFTTNENGRSNAYLLDGNSLEIRAVPSFPSGIIGGLKFSPDEETLGCSVNAGTAPADVYTVSVQDPESEAVRWTRSEVGGLDPDSFVAAEDIHFESFDGRMIPAYLYLPRSEGPHPVIINIHGGPESQSRPGFSGVIQSWIAEVGAAVLDPNVRGSDGYGKSYLKLDNGKLREDSVRDIGALIDWIDTRPDLDSSRVMVYGGSYGGYMVLASLIHFGDRLKAGIDIVGISDFITFLENTQDYRRDLRRVEYGDERDPEMRAFFEKISPLRNAGRIGTPLFVIQGQNDPRVPVTEAEQIVEEVRSNGRDVWYMNALNEGHGYARKENQDLMRDAVVMFMKTHL